jgi:hypothetical protein
MAEGLIDPEPYYCWLASNSVYPTSNIKPEEVVRLAVNGRAAAPVGTFQAFARRGTVTVIVPEARQLEDYKSAPAATSQGCAAAWHVASPAAIRKKAVWEAGGRRRVKADHLSSSNRTGAMPARGA